mmetsp:Transcript_125757/g.231696  ORF Transcript_125757/g.231696 Transcript_125757/m.231696 type:complete len:225 (-) Transcript_125757:18-692(-)
MPRMKEISKIMDTLPSRSIQKKKLNGYAESVTLRHTNSMVKIANAIVKTTSSSVLVGISQNFQTSDKNKASKTHNIVSVCQQTLLRKNLRTQATASKSYQPPRVTILKPLPSAQMPMSMLRCGANTAIEARTSKLRSKGSSAGLLTLITLDACCSDNAIRLTFLVYFFLSSLKFAACCCGFPLAASGSLSLLLASKAYSSTLVRFLCLVAPCLSDFGIWTRRLT